MYNGFRIYRGWDIGVAPATTATTITPMFDHNTSFLMISLERLRRVNSTVEEYFSKVSTAGKRFHDTASQRRVTS